MNCAVLPKLLLKGIMTMKALVLSITAGQGHNATAKAVCAYLESIGCEAEMLDTFNYLNRILGETVSKAGKRQLRIAETEKYAHVTFFLNGGRETPFELEDRILVNSPKVATYDLQPEMSAVEVTSKLYEAIRSEKEDMIILNFANGDMVGHTGVYNAICNAVGCIDGCVETVVTCALAHDYVVLLTADHGNADYAVNPDGSPNTAHSLNEVQFIVIGAGDEVKEVKDGALCNVAPTILKLMGIPQPAAMTAEPLI